MAKKKDAPQTEPGVLTRAEMAAELNRWIDAHNRDLSMAQAVRKMSELRDSLRA